MKISGDVSEIMNMVDSYSNLDHCWQELEEVLIWCFGEKQEEGQTN